MEFVTIVFFSKIKTIGYRKVGHKNNIVLGIINEAKIGTMFSNKNSIF